MSNYNPNQNYQQPYNPQGQPQAPQYNYGAPQNYYTAPQHAPQPAVVTDTMSIGSWVGTLILTSIPLVGLICLIVWCCSSDPAKKSRKNWAIAQLIIAAVVVVLTIILSIAGVGIIGALVDSLM